MNNEQNEKGDGNDGVENPSRARTPTVSPTMRERAIETLAAGMDATRRYWDKEGQKWIEEPDWSVRYKSAELVLAYADGRPVEMKVELTGGFEGYDQKLAKLCSTPEGLKLAVQAGLIGEVTPKNAKSQKAIEINALHSLNKPKKAENDALKSDGNAKGLF